MLKTQEYPLKINFLKIIKYINLGSILSRKYFWIQNYLLVY